MILLSRQTKIAVDKAMETFDNLVCLNEDDKLLIGDSIQIYFRQINRIRVYTLQIGGFTLAILFYIVLAILLIFWNQILSLHFIIHSPKELILSSFLTNL